MRYVIGTQEVWTDACGLIRDAADSDLDLSAWARLRAILAAPCPFCALMDSLRGGKNGS